MAISPERCFQILFGAVSLSNPLTFKNFKLLSIIIVRKLRLVTDSGWGTRHASLIVPIFFSIIKCHLMEQNLRRNIRGYNQCEFRISTVLPSFVKARIKVGFVWCCLLSRTRLWNEKRNIWQSNRRDVCEDEEWMIWPRLLWEL